MKDNTLIVVMGPTASGKTSLAITLAQYFETEIISCDARQFYKEMEIGTAKPNAQELAAATHHFINSHSVHDRYSAGDYEREALACLEHCFQKKAIAIMVGGSGLYVRMVCEGVDQFPTVNPNVRSELNALFQAEGLTPLQEELAAVDPLYYARVDLQNPVRIIRALEIYRTCHKPYSSFLNQPKEKRNFKVIKLAIDMDRAFLYERINQRVDLMIDAGLEEEAKRLYPLRHLNALQTVGYQEWNGYFENKITRAQAIELIKRNSRRYAKRQMTWCRKESNLHWLKYNSSKTEIVNFVQKILDGTQ